MEVATDGGSSWVEGDRISSEGMGIELKARRSWVETFECSGLGSSSWDEFDGDIYRRSLGSGSWDEVEGYVEEVEEDERKEELEGEQPEGEDDNPEDNGWGSINEDAVRLSEEEGLSEVITEYSGETEWGERGGGGAGCPDVQQANLQSTSSSPEPQIVVEHDLTTASPAFASDIPHTRAGSIVGSTPSSLPTPILSTTPSGTPTPLLSTTPTSVTIALPPELFRVNHNGSLSSMASFTSVEETESTAASSTHHANGAGTHYLGGASHFGIKTFSVVNVNVTVNV